MQAARERVGGGQSKSRKLNREIDQNSQHDQNEGSRQDALAGGVVLRHRLWAGVCHRASWLQFHGNIITRSRASMSQRRSSRAST